MHLTLVLYFYSYYSGATAFLSLALRLKPLIFGNHREWMHSRLRDRAFLLLENLSKELIVVVHEHRTLVIAWLFWPFGRVY